MTRKQKDDPQKVIDWILQSIIHKPKNITQISRVVNKERASISRLIHNEMKGLVELKDENKRGRDRLVKIKKKGYARLGINPNKKLSSKNEDKEEDTTQSYLKEMELKLEREQRGYYEDE